jgi:histidinol-phosphatase (PHP family)
VTPLHDYHVHSNYSDGEFIWQMAEAADDAGVAALGFADHCNVAPRERLRQRKKLFGFNLDTTYERRRQALTALNARGAFDVRLLDGVEMDYDPADEAAIESFLDEAGFEYAVGSVHFVGEEDRDIQSGGEFAADDEATRRAVVDDYFDRLVALADAELFDIAAHADLIERNPHLRGLATRDHYERAAEAFAASRTVPEINAGHLDREYGGFHPVAEFLDVLRDREVSFTFGTDAHSPEQLRRTVPKLRARFEELDVEPVRILDVE